MKKITYSNVNLIFLKISTKELLRSCVYIGKIDTVNLGIQIGVHNFLCRSASDSGSAIWGLPS